MSRTRYAVIGAGLAGSATAWQLARRGADVALLEAYTLGHAHGSSHGSARIIRRAYTDRFYAALTGQAWSDWAELEQETGEQLVSRTGGLDFGRDRDVPAIARVQSAEGIPHTLYSPAQAAERWPQFRFDSAVLHHPEAGVVDAARAVRVMCVRAEQLGADVQFGWPVAAVERHAGGYLISSVAGQRVVQADVVVVTTGAWLSDLLPALPLDPALLPPLQVTQQHVFHFQSRDSAAAWPVFLHATGRFRYGLPGGADVGPGMIKIGEHDHGRPTKASAQMREIDAATRDRVVDYVERCIPGLVAEPDHEAACLYTNTPTEDFVVDRTEGLVVVSPCSGHGAKFAPTIGSIAADLATGARAQTLPPFAFGARVGRATASSALARGAQASSR